VYVLPPMLKQPVLDTVAAIMTVKIDFHERRSAVTRVIPLVCWYTDRLKNASSATA
jgi:hypothetical protein